MLKSIIEELQKDKDFVTVEIASEAEAKLVRRFPLPKVDLIADAERMLAAKKLR